MKITKKIALFVLALIVFHMVRSFVKHIEEERKKYRQKGNEFEKYVLKHENDSHLQDDCHKKNQFNRIYDNPHSTYKGSIDTNMTTIFKLIFYIMSISVLLTYIFIVN